MAPHHEAACRQLLAHQGPALEAHRLALVLLGLVGHVPVKQGIVLVADLHNGGVQVEGQGVLNVVILHLAVFVLVGDVRPAGGAPDDLVEGHLVHLCSVKAVEHHQLRALQLVIDQLAHVAVVAEEGGSVGKQELLIHHPALGHGGIELIQHPHAIVLNDHPLCPGLPKPLFQIFPGQLLRRLHNTDFHRVRGELLRGVFLFPLLADQQQGSLPAAEALVLQCLLDELGLAAFQKAGKEEYGYFLCLITQYETAPSVHLPSARTRSRRTGR